MEISRAGKANLHRAIIDDPLNTGLASIESVIGVPREELLAHWSAALYASDRGISGNNALLEFSSWDFQDVFRAFFNTARLNPRPIPFAIKRSKLGCVGDPRCTPYFREHPIRGFR